MPDMHIEHRADDAKTELEAHQRAVSEAKDRIVEILREVGSFRFGSLEDGTLDDLLADVSEGKRAELDRIRDEAEGLATLAEGRMA